MGYSRKPSYHFNSEVDIIGDVPLNRTIVCNSFLGVPSVSFKYITSSSSSTIKAAYEAGNLEPIQSVLTSSATYVGNLLGTHAGTLKFFTSIYSGVSDENVSLTLTLSGALDSQIVLKDTNALWIEYTGSCTFDESLATYGVYLKERAAAQAHTKYTYGCVLLENSSLTWSADIASNGVKNASGDNVNIFGLLFNSYIKSIGVTISGASGNGISATSSVVSFSNSTSQNNGNNGLYCSNGSCIVATYSSFLNNGNTGIFCNNSSFADINGSTIDVNQKAGIKATMSKILATNCTVSNTVVASGVYSLFNSSVILDNSTIESNGSMGIYCFYNSNVSIVNASINNSSTNGVYVSNNSSALGENADVTNSGGYGIYITDNSSYADIASGSITGNTTYDIFIGESALVRLSGSASYGNSNISTNTHYTNGAFFKR